MILLVQENDRIKTFRGQNFEITIESSTPSPQK